MSLFSQDEETPMFDPIPGTGIEDYPDVSDETLYKAASRVWRPTPDGEEKRALKQDNSFLAASYGQEVADSVSVLNYFKEQAGGDVELAQFIKDFQYGDTDDSMILQHLRDIYDPEEKIPFSEKAFAGGRSALGTAASTFAKMPAALTFARYFGRVDFGISEEDEDVNRAGKILETVINWVPPARLGVAGVRIAADIGLAGANLLQKKPEDAVEIYTRDARGIGMAAGTGQLDALRQAQAGLDWGEGEFYGGAKAEQFVESAKQFRQILKPADIMGVDSDLFWYEYSEEVGRRSEEIKEFYTKGIRPEVAELFSVQLADTMGQYAAYAAAGWATPAVMLGSLYIEGHEQAARAALEKFPDADPFEIAEMVNAQALTYTAFAYPMEKLSFDRFTKFGAQRAVLGKGLKGGMRAALLNTRDELWRRGIGGITEGVTESMQEVLGGVITQRMPTAGELWDVFLLTSTSAFIWGLGSGAVNSTTKITHAEDISRRYGVSQDQAYEIQKRYEDSRSVAERLEIGKELLAQHAPAVARYEAAQRTEAISLNKFGHRVGADGKPLGAKEFADIDKSGKTDLEIAEMLPAGFDHTELFIRAVRGDADAQKQYNKEIVGKGNGPSILFQSAGDVRDIKLTPEENAQIDVDVADSIAELGWDEVSDMVVLSQSAGIELSNELRTAIKTKLENTGMDSKMLRRQIQVKLNNVASEVAIQKEQKSIHDYIKGETVSGKALSRSQRGYSILNDGFSFLHNWRKNTNDEFFEELAEKKAREYNTKPSDEVRHLRFSNLRGIAKLKAIYYPLVSTGDIRGVAEMLRAQKFKPEGVFSRKVMAATYQFSLLKKEQKDGNSWAKDPDIAPKVQEIGKVFNISLDRAADVYAIWEAVGLPIDKILMRRDTSLEAASQTVEGELTQPAPASAEGQTAAQQADIAEYQEAAEAFERLSQSEAVGTQEWTDAWQRVEDVKNKYGGFPPEVAIRNQINNADTLYQSGFFSPAEKAIDGFKQETFTTEQLEAMVRKAPGVKQEELNDIGFFDWIQGVEGKVTKAQALEFIRNNGPKIEEVTKGTEQTVDEQYVNSRIMTEVRRDFLPSVLGDRNLTDALFDWEDGKITDEELSEISGVNVSEIRQLLYEDVPTRSDDKFGGPNTTLPGGQNYREVLLTLPAEKSPIDPSEPGSAIAQRDFDRDRGVYRSSHWGEANVLAHVRMNDRTGQNGEKILFIEEIQSDWHQAGRKQGYEDGKTARMVHSDGTTFATQAQADAYIAENGGTVRFSPTEAGVPDAPFKKSWSMLAFKTVLRDAVANGYDSVAWTPGHIQSERYTNAIQGAVDSVQWADRRIKINRPQADMITLDYDADGKILNGPAAFMDKNISDILGKNIAQEVLDKPNGTIKKEGLHVGGELFRKLYDSDGTSDGLPKLVGKYVKKMGGEVGKVQVAESDKTHIVWDKEAKRFVGEDGLSKADAEGLVARDPSRYVLAQKDGKEVWNLPITDAMRNQIAEGQALYQQKKGSVQFMQDGNALVTAFQSSDVSTALHEAAHIVRRWMFDPDADESTRASDADMQTTYNHYGIADQWTRAQEEAFADDFVNWIQNGRSPDAKLNGTFKRLSSWLTKAYGKLVNKTSPEMSTVFDNLIVREHMTAESAEVGQNRYGKEEQYIRNEAQTRATELFNRLGLDQLTFSESEKAAVMQYVAQQQGYITEEDGLPTINLADLPKSADFLLKTWNGVAKELESEIRVVSDALGKDFKSIRDEYFPLRHSFEQDTADTDVFEAAGERITAHRRGSFDGVVKDPVAQLTAYINDVVTYVELGQSILRERASVMDDAPAIAEAWKKNEENVQAEEAGESPKHKLTPAEMESLEKLKTLQALEVAGEDNNIAIQRSALTSPVFMEAVIRSATMRKQTDLVEGATIQQTAAHHVKEMLKNFSDPAAVAAYKDGISYDSMRETGQFMGGNTYILRNKVYQNVANMKESVLVAQENIRTAINLYVKEGGQHKQIDRELAEIFSRKDTTRQLMQSVNNLDQIRALFQADQKTAELLNQVSKVLNDVEAATKTPFTMDIQTDTGRISANQSKEMGLLLRKQQDGKLTEKETKRLDYLYMQKNGRNKFVRWVLEKTALNEKRGLVYLDNLIQRSYRNIHIGESMSFLQSWETYLKAQGQTETADYWRNYRERNLEGKMYDAENRILDLYGKTTKKGADFVLGLMGKESVATAEDIKLNTINALNHLHRARINAWLTGNLGWSLTTQASSLAMTAGTARGKNFLIAVRDSATGKKKADPLNEYADQYAGSIVKKIKETAGSELGKVVAMSEFQENKIEQTWREIVRNKANEFSGRVEDKTVKISYLAGKMRGEQLGLRGEEANAFGDYIAATTQSMYDQYTRNPALQSHLFRAAAPMQSYVFTAYTQALSMMNQSGIERSGKDRAIEFLEWKLAAKMWGFFWSMVFGDDIAKAIFDPTKKTDTLGSHIPLLGESIQRFKNKKQNEFADWVGADFLTVDNYEFPGNLRQFTAGTKRAFSPNTDRKLREASRWSVKYITPFIGIPGSRMMDNFSQMIDAYRTDGYVYDYLGERRYDEIPWLSDNPVKAASAIAWGTIMGVKAVNEREAVKKQRQN